MINSIVPIVSNSSCESVLAPQLRVSFRESQAVNVEMRPGWSLFPPQPRTILAVSIINLAPLPSEGRDCEERSDSRV